MPIDSKIELRSDYICSGVFKHSTLFLDQCRNVANLINKLHGHVYKDGDLLAENFQEQTELLQKSFVVSL